MSDVLFEMQTHEKPIYFELKQQIVLHEANLHLVSKVFSNHLWRVRIHGLCFYVALIVHMFNTYCTEHMHEYPHK